MGRIENAISEYWKRKNKKGIFYLNDFEELKNLSNDKFDLINNSLIAGYIIGYRSAKREIKKNKKGV